MQGRLNEKPIAKVIRLIAKRGLSGLLRVSRGKTIKAIFFESGNPVFAISNSANEQLEHKLLQEQIISAEQLEKAKLQAGKSNKLGAALVEIGAITQDTLIKKVRQQVMEMIVSLFEWQEGDYSFDEKMRASHEIKLETKVTDILLEGARLAAQKPAIAELIAPEESVVIRASMNQTRMDSGILAPIESYVLSRIDMPTTINKVGLISGLPDHEAHRAVCALVASGYLKLADNNGEDDEEEGQSVNGEELERFKEEISRKMHFYNNADYYEILEITRQSSASEIKAAYYQLAKRFHPDRFHQTEYAEIRQQLEALFTRITQAYETLSNSGSRSAYDQKSKRVQNDSSNGASPVMMPPPIPVTKPIPPSITKPKPSTGNLKTNSGNLKKPSNTGELNQPAAASANAEATKQLTTATSQTTSSAPPQNAEYFFHQGRARLQKMDIHSAIHLLREAVKLEPNKGPYHFHLGSALLRSPRNRREAEEHFAKAAFLDPFSVQLRLKIGMLFKESGNRPRAEQYFKEALSLDPDNKVAKKELGAVGKKQGDETPIWKQDVGSIAKRFFKKS